MFVSQRIPITMATQHPDNASVPWWRGDAFIPTQDEIEELLIMFKDLGMDEYMWDWEGKYVDESVGEKIFSRGREFFAKHPLGKDIRLTYRIPAYEEGRMHRMARAFMNILSLADLAVDIGVPSPPVTEMFLPLTTAAEQPINVRKAFYDIEKYHRSVFHESKKSHKGLMDDMDITPLVEDVPSLLSIEKIVGPYWKHALKESPDIRNRGQRIFLARSDPAMNAGLVPAVLALKVALSSAYKTGNDLGFDVYPVIGTGSLPFRGSVNPSYTKTFLPQYAGVRTYSIQSAFRYDYPMEEVKKALKIMEKEVPKQKVVTVSAEDKKIIVELCEIFTDIWKPTIEKIAVTINMISAHIPRRRERLQHIGLFGYSRGIGKVRLPRAIGFTAALYSIGVPPELIATGRGLQIAVSKGYMDVVNKYYPALIEDIKHAGKYLNRENLALLAKRDSIWKDIQEDIRAIELILGIELGPEKPRHIIHRNLTSTIYHRLHSKDCPQGALSQEIVEAGIIRRSLG